MSVSLTNQFLPENFNDQPSEVPPSVPGENDFSSFLVFPMPPAPQPLPAAGPGQNGGGETSTGEIKPAGLFPTDPVKFEARTKNQQDPIREEPAQQIKPQFPGPADAPGVPAEIEAPHDLRPEVARSPIADTSRKPQFEIVSSLPGKGMTSISLVPHDMKQRDGLQVIFGTDPGEIQPFQQYGRTNTEFSIVRPQSKLTSDVFGSILRDVRDSNHIGQISADQRDQGIPGTGQQAPSETTAADFINLPPTEIFRPNENRVPTPLTSISVLADAGGESASIELTSRQHAAESEVPAGTQVKPIDSFEKLTGPERLTFSGIFSRPDKSSRPDSPLDTAAGIISADSAIESGGTIARSSGAADVPAPAGPEVASQVAPAIIELEKFIGPEMNMDSLKMRLSPAELGSVEITLIRNDDGSMSAQLMTETESAQSSLSESLTQLRESLEFAGIQVEAIEIGCKSFSSADQGDGREGPQMQQNTGANASGSAAESGTAAGEAGDNRLIDLQA